MLRGEQFPRACTFNFRQIEQCLLVLPRSAGVLDALAGVIGFLGRADLAALDHLRQVIGFRGYAQRDPLNEYKAEAFSLFEAMSQSLREAVTAQLMRVEIMAQPPTTMEPSPLPAPPVKYATAIAPTASAPTVPRNTTSFLRLFVNTSAS